MTRIIGGTAGGRRLETPRGQTTRPTSDRVREALFSAIEARTGSLDGLRFLDLYAGSGLFTARLGELVAPDGFVLGVEGDGRAVENGILNTEHLENVEWRANRVDRELESLVEQGVSADLAVLDRDYFAVPDAEIADTTSVMTVLGGHVVHGTGDFQALAPALPPAMPDWSPVNRFGGYGGRLRAEAVERRGAETAKLAAACGCGSACGVHGHGNAAAWASDAPAGGDRAFWGALGCSCWMG